MVKKIFNKKILIIVIGIILALVSALAIFLLNSSLFSGENGKIVNQEILSGNNDNDVIDEKKISGTISKKTENFLFAGIDGSGQLTDVIMLVCVDYEKSEVNILQIPRDTYVEEGTSSTGKINSAYHAGDKELKPINRLVAVINDQYQIKVDHYATVTIDSFRNCVDAIGGVPINIPYEIGDETGKISAGEQVLDGEKAEWLVRHRHSYAEGDIGRVKMQRLFVAALVNKIKSLGTEEMISLAPVLVGEFTTDLTVVQIKQYIEVAMTIDMSDIKMFILPGEGVMYEKQAVWSTHKNETADLLNSYFRPYSSPIPADKLKITELVHTGEYYENTEDDLQSLIDGNAIGKKNDDSTLPVYTHTITLPPKETETETPDLTRCTFIFNSETGEWDMTDNGESYTTGPVYYVMNKYDESWHLFNDRAIAEEYINENELYLNEEAETDNNESEENE